MSETSDPASVHGGSRRRRLWALVGLVLAFGWTPLLGSHRQSLANVHDDILVIVAEWTVVILLVVIGFAVNRRRPRFYGLRAPRGRDFLVLVAAFLGTYVVIGLVSRLFAIRTSMLGMSGLLSVPVSVKLGLVITAAVCEEFMFRGFAIEELVDWTGSLGLAAVLTWLTFVAAHIARYGWTTGLVIPAVAGGALTLLYAWRRNLPVNIFLHAVMDGLGIFVLPVLMRGHGG